MPTLLVRFAGPLQAWGTSSRFDIREAGTEPSKSGVLGVFCAALGKPRTEDPGDPRWPTLSALCALRLGVRADAEGRPMVDYQTAGGEHRLGSERRSGVRRASDSPGDTVQSRRHYLADADFLIGLEGDAELLGRLRWAVENPVWQMFLGRKACLPAPPITEPLVAGYGWSDASVVEALAHAPRRSPGLRRAVVDARSPDSGDRRFDTPLSFEPRRFAARYVEVMEL